MEVDDYEEPWDFHEASRDPYPASVELVQGPSFKVPMVAGKTIHATIKFNFPIAWLDEPEGWDRIAGMAAEEATLFMVKLRNDRSLLD